MERARSAYDIFTVTRTALALPLPAIGLYNAAHGCLCLARTAARSLQQPGKSRAQVPEEFAVNIRKSLSVSLIKRRQSCGCRTTKSEAALNGDRFRSTRFAPRKVGPRASISLSARARICRCSIGTRVEVDCLWGDLPGRPPRRAEPVSD